MPRNIQMALRYEAPATLIFSFPGRATNRDFMDFSAVIASELQRKTGIIERVVFDLSQVDEVINTAARIFDLAVGFSNGGFLAAMRTEIWIPQNVYADLYMTDQPTLPSVPDSNVPVQGVYILIRERADRESDTLRPDEVSRVLLSCRGKIRRIDEDNQRVFVSLFTDQGEVIGEMSAERFSEGKLAVGMNFQYQAIVKGEGVVEIQAVPFALVNLSDDEMIEIWNEVVQQIPPDET